MTLKEIYNVAVPEKKRKEEHFNFWVSLVLRPASILGTAFFLKTKFTPIGITKMSIISLLLGFGFFAFGNNVVLRLLGWIFFLIWGVLDCVDGNLARCKEMCSALGDLWDTVGGYMAMILIYFSAGIAAFYNDNFFVFIDSYWFLILGGATSVFSIFPRLVMHKKKSTQQDSDAVKELSDKSRFGLFKIIALNLISPIGFMQGILLISMLSNLLNIYICFYFVVNFIVMSLSLKQLLSK